MMIFKKAIPRRTFLRSMGATLALPLLEGMIPAFATTADTASKAPIRLGFAYLPNGMWPMEKWTPKTEGANFELTPTLEPLAKFKDQLIVLTGLAQKEGLAAPGEGSQDHSRDLSTFLTGIRVKPTSGKDFRAATTLDQIVAQEVGKTTQLTSLEVSLAPADLVGACESGWTCVYLSTMSWRTPTTPLPMENKPRALFERLFGDSDSTDRVERLALMRKQQSILDGLNQEMAGLVKGLGPSDRAKLSQYFDAIRDVERRIQLAEEQSSRELPRFDRPVGVPASFEEYANLMFDLEVLAFQTDLTRVISTMWGPGGGFAARSYPEIGIADLHHTLSHHQNNPDTIEKLFKINRFHLKLYSHFLEKLRATPDGDGNLLDHTILLYGSGLCNGNIHQHDNLPLLLLGGGSGKLKGGRHLRFPDWTPMTNLHLTLLDKLGLPMDKFGDSTGKLEPLSV